MKQTVCQLTLILIFIHSSTFGQHIQAEREMLRRLDKLLITTQECRDGNGNFNIIENRLDIWNGYLYLLERTSNWSGKPILPNEWVGIKIPLNSLSRVRLLEIFDSNCINRLNSQIINAAMEIFYDKPPIVVIVKFDNNGNPIEKIGGGSSTEQSIQFNIDLYSSSDIPIEQEKKNFLNWFKIFKSS